MFVCLFIFAKSLFALISLIAYLFDSREHSTIKIKTKTLNHLLAYKVIKTKYHRIKQ